MMKDLYQKVSVRKLGLGDPDSPPPAVTVVVPLTTTTTTTTATFSPFAIALGPHPMMFAPRCHSVHAAL